MLEFAHAYPGLALGPDLPWPLFIVGCARLSRFHARTSYQVLEGVGAGLGSMFGGGMESKFLIDRLFRTSFPVGREGPKMALVQSEGGD